ncbi:ribonuclease [Encephalitozoon hellem ATCC 50504]|uniref:Exosome RNA binding protein RRP41 n=1 Tax=Encephalitozoon hellem TaxID=27973 RepID=A0A9Q9F8S6_ENCHE|nr:ribonuclease [Encephalitozoon hellem ATCC 50504]AFM98975.1 ribonuclease [Encephalitozoon hellem ATCC 50504]UTX43989.1 exosome RNA binding protein RRP41 [Encephalitozoon hellem]WEL39474.1 exosome RNA binding protein RRP41 [Encephalitozoon hellem]|eukprot:XP_003887956.1 ribonuclease [Encephalitozoon hellem ATCC 50504]
MLVSEEGFREDGRRPNELRRVEVAKKMVEGKGIVDMRQGNTQVSVMCSGPKEIGKMSIEVEFYAVSRQEPVNEKRMLEYEDVLLDIFSDVLLPEALVDIKVIVREDGGSLLSTMINCITICLSYFGMPLTDMCYSATVGGGCVDLTSTEESQRIPVVTVAYLMNRKSIAYLSLNGRIVCDKLHSCILEAVGACYSVREHFKDFFSLSSP